MRRRSAEPRAILPDPKYGSPEVARLINRLMMQGKKTVAQNIVYQALAHAEQQAKRPALEVLREAIQRSAPLLEVRPRRVGGATYQVPIEVAPRRGLFLAMGWIIDAARSRKGRPMAEKLGQELFDASRGEGVAVKKREDTHRMAEANRVFAHYRW